MCDTEGPLILSCNLTEKLGIIKVSKSKQTSVVNNCTFGTSNRVVKEELCNKGTDEMLTDLDA